MSKAALGHNNISALARQILTAWNKQAEKAQNDRPAGNAGERVNGKKVEISDWQSFIVSLAAAISLQKDGGDNTDDLNWLSSSLRERLQKDSANFVQVQKRRLRQQGLERVSESGLRAFFLSSLYEHLRYKLDDTALLNADVSQSKRARPKRGGASYFTPPSLAYLAAYRALSEYFGRGKKNLDNDCPALPLICDPAMGTALYLVAALDYLAIEKPQLSRAHLARQCLTGVDLDAITCCVAKECLAMAIGAGRGEAEIAQSEPALLWSDAISASLPSADIVLCNPPWDIVKKIKGKDKGDKIVPSRVNKARSAALRARFVYQSVGDTSYYKLFLERSYQILKAGGVAAILTPASLCGDKGASRLRTLLLDHCQWLSIDGFTNEDMAFAIHPQFKYVLVSFKKGAVTDLIKARFGLMAGASILVQKTADPAELFYGRNQLQALGGPALAIPQLSSGDDLKLLSQLYQNHPSLISFLETGGYFFRREFDMTLDRHRFLTAKNIDNNLPRYDFDRDRHDDRFLPLFEGNTIGQFESFRKSSVTRYFIKRAEYLQRVPRAFAKVGFVSITSPHNSRTMIASLLPDLPAGNSLPVLVFACPDGATGQGREDALYTTAIFNSFVFDWILRLRLTGNNLSYHILEDLPFPARAKLPEALSSVIVQLSNLLNSAVEGQEERLRWRVWLEVCILRAYGLTREQTIFILRDCHYPVDFLLKRRRLIRAISNDQIFEKQEAPDQRSFFRIDKGLPPEQRLPNLVAASFDQLQNIGNDFVQELFKKFSSGQRLVSLPSDSEKALSDRFATRSRSLGQTVPIWSII